MTDPMRDYLDSMAPDVLEAKTAMCTGYVIVAEYVDEKGDFYTWTTFDDKMPPWRVEGLLRYAISNEIYDSETEDEEEY